MKFLPVITSINVLSLGSRRRSLVSSPVLVIRLIARLSFKLGFILGVDWSGVNVSGLNTEITVVVFGGRFTFKLSRAAGVLGLGSLSRGLDIGPGRVIVLLGGRAINLGRVGMIDFLWVLIEIKTSKVVYGTYVVDFGKRVFLVLFFAVEFC